MFALCRVRHKEPNKGAWSTAFGEDESGKGLQSGSEVRGQEARRPERR